MNDSQWQYDTIMIQYVPIRGYIAGNQFMWTPQNATQNPAVFWPCLLGSEASDRTSQRTAIVAFCCAGMHCHCPSMADVPYWQCFPWIDSLFFLPPREMYIDHKKDLYRSDTSQLNTMAIAMLDVGSGFLRLQASACHGFAMATFPGSPWQPWPGTKVSFDMTNMVRWENMLKRIDILIWDWWFGTWLDYFPFHIWDVILSIDALHHFSRWLKPPTSDAICGFHFISFTSFRGFDAVWYNESEIDIWTHYEHPPWNYLYKIGNRHDSIEMRLVGQFLL